MESHPAYIEIRSKYIDAKTTRKLCRNHNLKFRHGFYSRREAGMVQAAVDEFLKERELGPGDLESHLVSEEPFPMHELIRHVTSRIPFRTFKSVDTFLTWFYNPLTQSTFSKEDDAKLLELVEKKGYRWKEIGLEMEQMRTRCRIRFMRMKGLFKERLLVRDIEAAIGARMPATEAEWEKLCTVLGRSRAVVTKFVDQYMKRPVLYRERDISEIALSAYVLKYNFYCGVDIDVPCLIGFLGSSAEAYAAQPGDGADSLAFYTENFGRAFRSLESFDLNVDIATDDIFWTNIINDYHIFSTTAKSKFYALRSAYGIYTYQDLYSTLRQLGYEYFQSQVQRRVLGGEHGGEPAAKCRPAQGDKAAGAE